MNGFGLINMSRPKGEHEQELRVTLGRVYDPKVGRFLSPDPVLKDAGNTQNMNRYSYVWNNPLRYTDPSGYTSRSADRIDNYSETGQVSSGSANWYGTGGGGTMSWNLGTIYNADGSMVQAGPSSEVIDAWFDSGCNAAGVPLDKFMNLISEDGKPIQMSMYTATTENGKTVLTHFMYDYEVPTVKVAQSGGDRGVEYYLGIASILLGTTGNQIGSHMGSVYRYRPIMTGNGLSGEGLNLVLKSSSSLYRYGIFSGKFATKLGAGLRIGGNMFAGLGIGYTGYQIYTNQIPQGKGIANMSVGAFGLTPIGFIPSTLYFGVDTFYPGGVVGFADDNGTMHQNFHDATGWSMRSLMH